MAGAGHPGQGARGAGTMNRRLTPYPPGRLGATVAAQPTYPQGRDLDPLAMLIDRFFWLEDECHRLRRQIDAMAAEGLCGPPPPPPDWLAEIRRSKA